MRDVTELEWATARVRDWGKRMVSILGLHSTPVGVQLVAADQPALERATVLPQHHYCQALSESGCGAHLLLSAGKVACPAAAIMFGFRHPRANLQSGDGPEGFGIAVLAE